MIFDDDDYNHKAPMFCYFLPCRIWVSSLAVYFISQQKWEWVINIFLCHLSADALASCQHVDNELIVTLLCLVSTDASVNCQHVDVTK